MSARRDAQMGKEMEQGSCSVFSAGTALEMILEFDGTGRICYANAEAEKKLEYGDGLCGQNICAVFPNEFKTEENVFTIQCGLDEKLKQFVAYRGNFTCFPVEARVIKSGGSPEMYVCMANDMLEKDYLKREIVQVKQEAEHALKVKSEFVANVTHELRTPVNGVLGNVKELLAEDVDSRTMKSLRMIERCCVDMNKIIDNILDFSKLEAGKFTLEPRRFHVREMLDNVKGTHSAKITEKGLEFFMTVSPNVPEYVIGDELRIKQVLNNLLSNALKFTSVGKVTLEVLKTAQMDDRTELFFIVIDSGIGIDKADKDKLFRSFSQVDASISRRYGGTGLGLNISKQLVELMGGRIGVESQKGKGSTFSFSIWVGSCGEEKNTAQQTDVINMSSYTLGEQAASGQESSAGGEAMKHYGTPENREALKKALSKLILCVEMENWEKAEMFMETIRQLAEGAPHEVGRVILRLKMAVQRENYDRITAGFEELKGFLQAEEVRA